MAPHKMKDGNDMHIFWDKQCLNVGQDWEDGFLHGITSSSVIILLLSNKVPTCFKKRKENGGKHSNTRQKLRQEIYVF